MKLDLEDLGVDQEQQYRPGVAGGGGGTLGLFGVGVCCWDPGTLSLYQS